MKKLSKKQKLIGFIAILLVAVIIAIVITTSIIKNNNQVANEGYSSTIANADSNLIANYIKEGITIGGITGTLKSLNTFDATATAEDIAEGKVAYARGKRIIGTYKTGTNTIQSEDLQISATNVYYADLEGDGIVDGVIFADLAGPEESRKWGTKEDETYIIPSEKNLKEYYIERETYSDDFGIGKVITPKSGTDGNDRFYVMALDDFDSNYHYWYKNGSLSDIELEDSFAKEGEEARGRANTLKILKLWNEEYNKYGTKDDNDIWSVIQKSKDEEKKSELDKGWFVPNKSEWAVFGATFLNSSNYSSFNLDYSYWSSSLYTPIFAVAMGLDVGEFTWYDLDIQLNLRLAITF